MILHKYHPYKYNIKSKLISLGIEIKDVYEGLDKDVRPSQSTFSRYLNIKVEDNQSIPSDLLMAIAKVIGCQMEDLYTNQKVA